LTGALDAARPEPADELADALAALVGLGFARAVAAPAVARAAAHVGASAPFEALIRAAIAECMPPPR
jgi:Holliday junction resolvasome RuvABC DNA-binding subunit